MEWRRPWIVWFVMISVISGVLKNPSFFPPKPFGWRTPGDRFWYSIFSSWPISGLNKRRQAWKAVMTFSRSTQKLILSLKEKKSWRMLLPRIKGDRACLLIRHLVVVKNLNGILHLTYNIDTWWNLHRTANLDKPSHLDVLPLTSRRFPKHV